MTVADKINLAIAIATALSVIASMIVAILTFHIAKSNRLTAELMKAEIDAATRPYITITPTIRTGTPLIQIVIENTGQSSAENLTLKLDKDFFFNAERSESKNLNSYTAFSETIKSFPPRCKLVFDLGTGPAIFNNPQLCPLQFRITASYSTPAGSYLEHTTVDMQPFRLTTVPHDPVADQVEKLTFEVKRLANIIQQRAA